MAALVRLISFVAVLCLYAATAFAAYQPGAVVQLPNAAALTSGNWVNTPQVQLSGYRAQADGGEGTLVYMVGGCGTEDDGYCFHDAASHAFARTNFNNDLRQYGAVKGSAYDCSPTTGSGVAGCTGATTLFANLQTAAATLGIKSCVTTGGVQIKFTGSPTVNQFACLTANKPWSENGENQFIDTPGTIWLDHGVTITMSQNSVVQNALIVPSFLGEMNSGTGPQSLADNYTVIHTMTSNGDTGVTCLNQSCTVRDTTISGFDTAYEGSKAHNIVDHVAVDANVCFYFHQSGADTHWGPTECQPYAIQTANQRQDFDVLTMLESPDTPGICRVTINTAGSGPPNTDLATGDNAWVSGADNTTGGAGTNGRWVVTVIGLNTLDLQGSICHGGTLDGPTATLTYTAGNVMATVSSAAGLKSKMQIKSPPAGIAGGTFISNNGIWGRQKIIILSAAPTASGSASVTFTGGAYTEPGGNDCANGDVGVCITFTTQERVNAGASAGGIAAGGTGCATGYLIGGFVNVGDGNCNTGDPTGTEKSSGFDDYSAFCYAHAICYHLANAYNARFTNSAMDAARSLGDELTSWLLLDGNFKSVAFMGGKAGKVGSGATVNPDGMTDKGCANIAFLNIDLFDLEPGTCFVNTGNSGGGGNTFVASGVTSVSFDGSLAGMELYYQDKTAAYATSTIGAPVNLGASWWGGQFATGGPIPSVDASTLAAVLATCGGGAVTCISGNDTAGAFTVGTWTANVVLNFANAWANQPSCTMQDLTDPLVLLAPVSVTTSHMNFGASGGGPTANDKIQWFCRGTSN